ncbi:hypothetical protein BG004_008353 [Podila humilis]|nr:hypothetical protein BG004_008353 [Podila humilis]
MPPHTSTHPLELPEILLRVGYFVQQWCHDEFYWEIYLSDLVACIKVNRLFYRTLRPLLWTMFHTEMNRYNIPPESVKANIHHVYYLHILYPDQPSLWDATNLEFLLAHRHLPATSILDLIRANPRIFCLEWHFPCRGSRKEIEDIIPTLATHLPLLRILYIKEWRREKGIDLAPLLQGVPLLQELQFYKIRGFTFDEAFFGFSRASICNHPLLHLTTLRLDIEWNQNSAKLENILRLFPSLQHLNFNPLDDCPIVEISKNIKECCPQLKVLNCSRHFDHEITYRIWYPSQEKDRALVEAAPMGVTDFEIPLCDFTAEIAETLLTRFSRTMTRLALYIYCGGDDLSKTIGCLSELLFSFVSLKDLVFSIVGGAWEPAECMELFSKPWGSQDHLQSFELHGVITGLCRGQYGTEDGEYDTTCPPYTGDDVFEKADPNPDLSAVRQFCESLGENMQEDGSKETDKEEEEGEGKPVKFLQHNGWTLQPYNDCAWLESRDGNILFKRFLHHVVSMPCMKAALLNWYSWDKAEEREEKERDEEEEEEEEE